MFAVSTKKTYSSYLAMYYKYCQKFIVNPVPVSQQDLSRYIAYLSYDLKFSSITNYLSVVRLLHLEAGYGNPLDSHYISTVKRGVRRLLGDSSASKLPITPSILLGIRTLLSFDLSFHVAFWAACLVAFFSFFRKSNLLPESLGSYDPNKQLSVHNISFNSEGVIIKVSWSKTIQYQDRVLQIPLPFIQSSPLCPSTALWLASRVNKGRHLSPFQFQNNGLPSILTYPVFVKFLKQCLDGLGFPSHQYSGHSFRRGGASFALESGVPADLVQTQGDWRSDAYKVYIDPSLKGRRMVAESMAKSILHYNSLN